MQRTNIIQLKPTSRQKIILKEMMLLSSCVYNMTNYEIRQQFFNHEKVSGFHQLQQKIQNKPDYQLLGRSYGLPRIQQYAETNSARFKLIASKTQKKVGLPKYYKNRKTNTTILSHLVIDNSQYSIKKNHVEIPMSRQMRKKYHIGQTFKIKYNGILKHQGKQQRGQIHFKNGQFYLYQSVEVKDVDKKPIINSVGIDLGIKRLLSYYVSDNINHVIGNKRFFNQYQHYVSLIAKEQTFLSTINRKSSNKLKRLYVKRKKYQNNLFDNIISNFFKRVIRNNVQQIFIGDVKGIRENANHSKIVNSMINNYWSYDIFYHKLECKAEMLGITVNKITEEYTSKTCPNCLSANSDNCKDRKFECVNCGYSGDRDIIGARNILSKGMYGSIQNIHQNETVLLEVSA